MTLSFASFSIWFWLYIGLVIIAFELPSLTQIYIYICSWLHVVFFIWPNVEKCLLVWCSRMKNYTLLQWNSRLRVSKGPLWYVFEWQLPSIFAIFLPIIKWWYLYYIKFGHKWQKLLGDYKWFLPFFFFLSFFWAIAKKYSHLFNRVHNVEVRAYKFEFC